MSLSKHVAGEIPKASHFFACQNRRVLIHSMERCPTEAFFSLDLPELTRNMLILGEFDSCFPPDSKICRVNSWVTASLFIKVITFPISCLFLSRVDLWDLHMTKKRRGGIRRPILASLTPRKLQGTPVIISSMGRDEGLKERVDEHIFI